MNGQTQESDEIPDADQSQLFWSRKWSESKEKSRYAEWLKKLNNENNYQKQECLVITKEMVSKQSKKISHWKAPEGDGI